MSFIDLFDQYISEVRCVDIGAMIYEHGDSDGHGKRIKAFFAHPKVTVIGFEPQEDKCAELNDTYANHLYLPTAVGDGSARPFHVTQSGFSSSFFPVDYSIVDQLNFPLSSFNVIDTIELNTVCLDDVGEAQDCDFLKIDAEGAELMILENARSVLASCTVAQLEVNFIPIRHAAPLFGDVERAITEAGFMFHRMGLMGVNFKPWAVTGNVVPYISQEYAGDAIYVKDFRSLGDFTTDKLFRMAAVLDGIYQSIDLCACILREIDAREGLDTERVYGAWAVERQNPI